MAVAVLTAHRRTYVASYTISCFSTSIHIDVSTGMRAVTAYSLRVVVVLCSVAFALHTVQRSEQSWRDANWLCISHRVYVGDEWNGTQACAIGGCCEVWRRSLHVHVSAVGPPVAVGVSTWPTIVSYRQLSH